MMTVKNFVDRIDNIFEEDISIYWKGDFGAQECVSYNWAADWVLNSEVDRIEFYPMDIEETGSFAGIKIYIKRY